MVQALAKGSAQHPLLIHLIHCLHFFMAKCNIHIIAGQCGCGCLSHKKLSLILQSNLQAAIGAITNPNGPRGHDCAATSRLDILKLEDNVRFFINHALAQPHCSLTNQARTGTCDFARTLPFSRGPLRTDLLFIYSPAGQQTPPPAVNKLLLVSSQIPPYSKGGR